jgi:predicted dinucleotide-binding enzyme
MPKHQEARVRFGTIGAGAIGQAIASHLVRTGHEVVLSNRRGPSSLEVLTSRLGPRATAGTVQEAASADMVFLAVMWPDIATALRGLPDWENRILVDTTNQFDYADGRLQPVDTVKSFGIATGSEVVASLAPGARVIKAFNTLYVAYIAPDPRRAAGRQVLFYAGDDPAAKAGFAATFDEVGFATVDVGSLREGGPLMQAPGGILSALHVLKQD